MLTPNLQTVYQDPPTNSKSDYFFEPNPIQKETQIFENYNPKNSSPTLGKITFLLFLLSFLVLNPAFLWVTGLYSISAFILLNSPNNYSKRFEPKIAKVEILEPKIIEIELTPPASQPPATGAKPPQKPDDKVSLAELQENAKNSGNTKLANQIKNLENISKSLSDQINLKINFTK